MRRRRIICGQSATTGHSRTSSTSRTTSRRASSPPSTSKSATPKPCGRAVELDDKDAFCHLTLGRALLIAGERDLGFASVQRAVARNPNLALAHMFRGMALVGLERHAE